MNETDIIAPSESFQVMEGSSMKKKVAYHFQGMPKQQTAKGSAVSDEIHPPSFLPRFPNSCDNKYNCNHSNNNNGNETLSHLFQCNAANKEMDVF
ncbi:unnamed protein product [Hymenolepis diminuta]|uniref:Uncharacterized protein n=1 Tax=Hymenolepis diminuta TaxID=6216 RepID=A0A564Y202_HYMDI|nr:unnamed protein product [Hymenolepis diminuta]